MYMRLFVKLSGELKIKKPEPKITRNMIKRLTTTV